MTPLGYILLPVGLVGILKSERWLYRFFVFWTLFSATSVLNIGGSSGSGSAVQVWMFFGALWLLRLGLERVSLLSFSIDSRLKHLSFWMIAFLCVATVSLVMPVIINGSLQIASPNLGENDQTPLFLTGHNFTQVLYLIFGGMIAICVAHANLDDRKREETERIILYSGIFIACWGILQFCCNVTGIPYPDFLFNNSASGSAHGFKQVLDSGVTRVSSAATEPSVLAQALLTLLPLTLPAWRKRGFVFSRRRDRLITVLFIIVLVLSTSSTAYIGLLILALTFVAYSVRTRSFSKTKAVFVLGLFGTLAAAVIGVALASGPIVSKLVNGLLLSKASSGSAVERVMTITYAWGYFQKYPILGIGWGSATSHDVIVYLLSNVGIVGLVVFFCMILSVVRSNWQKISRSNSPLELSREVWLMSLVAFILTSLFIGFPMVFGNFWLVLGMAMATACRTATASDLSVAVRAQRPIARVPFRTEP